MLIKDRDPRNIKYGSTLAQDGFHNLDFDFMLANPPYGKSWKLDKETLEEVRFVGRNEYKYSGMAARYRTFSGLVT